MSVVQYFQEKYNISLKYTFLPALQCGSEARPIYLPMEVFTLCGYVILYRIFFFLLLYVLIFVPFSSVWACLLCSFAGLLEDRDTQKS